ncbi:MAG: Ig-like domain-containing protein, partial [Planctomycetes bacterium]|nr:Ig-like domain-containing protein [Planctomycetota bacterium]
RISVSSSVLDYRDKPLTVEASVATTVGQDTTAARVLGFTKSSSGGIGIIPGNGKKDVNPTTSILVTFTKPVQPRDVGTFFTMLDKTPDTRGISLSATIAATVAPVIYYADPLTMSDFCHYTVTPAYQFPGQVTVNIGVNNTIHALSGQVATATTTTTFTTGTGPGIVNAPVAPEAIYIGRAGQKGGVSVIDLNGFGQGTGDLTNTAWEKNPNIAKPGVAPVLQQGRTNLDAGGEGVLTLVKDTNLNDLLLDSTTVAQVGDIHIG